MWKETLTLFRLESYFFFCVCVWGGGGGHTKSVDPVQMPQNAAADQDLHYLLTGISLECTDTLIVITYTRNELIQWWGMDKSAGQKKGKAMYIQYLLWLAWEAVPTDHGFYYTPVLKKRTYYGIGAVRPSVCLSVPQHSCAHHISETVWDTFMKFRRHIY